MIHGSVLPLARLTVTNVVRQLTLFFGYGLSGVGGLRRLANRRCAHDDGWEPLQPHGDHSSLAATKASCRPTVSAKCSGKFVASCVSRPSVCDRWDDPTAISRRG